MAITGGNIGGGVSFGGGHVGGFVGGNVNFGHGGYGYGNRPYFPVYNNYARPYGYAYGSGYGYAPEKTEEQKFHDQEIKQQRKDQKEWYNEQKETREKITNLQDEITDDKLKLVDLDPNSNRAKKLNKEIEADQKKIDVLTGQDGQNNHGQNGNGKAWGVHIDPATPEQKQLNDKLVGLLANANNGKDEAAALTDAYMLLKKSGLPNTGLANQIAVAPNDYITQSGKTPAQLLQEISHELARNGTGKEVNPDTLAQVIAVVEKGQQAPVVNPPVQDPSNPNAQTNPNGQSTNTADANNTSPTNDNKPAALQAWNLPAADYAAKFTFEKGTKDVSHPGAVPQGLAHSQIQYVQALLYSPGSKEIDGKWGANTQARFEDAAKEAGLTPEEIKNFDFTKPETEAYKKLNKLLQPNDPAAVVQPKTIDSVQAEYQATYDRQTGRTAALANETSNTPAAQPAIGQDGSRAIGASAERHNFLEALAGAIPFMANDPATKTMTDAQLIHTLETNKDKLPDALKELKTIIVADDVLTEKEVIEGRKVLQDKQQTLDSIKNIPVLGKGLVGDKQDKLDAIKNPLDALIEREHISLAGVSGGENKTPEGVQLANNTVKRDTQVGPQQ